MSPSQEPEVTRILPSGRRPIPNGLAGPAEFFENFFAILHSHNSVPWLRLLSLTEA